MRPKDFEALFGCPDLESMVNYLLGTSYGPSVRKVSEKKDPVERLEEGLRENFSETLVNLFHISRGEPEEMARILMEYWDLCNLKTILRGLASGVPELRMMENMIPTATYGESALRELCRQDDLPSLFNLLVSWGDPNGWTLKKAFGRVPEKSDLVPLETALDRSYFERAFRRIRSLEGGQGKNGLFSFFLSAQVDRINLLTALKAAEDKMGILDESRYYLQGGLKFSQEMFSRVFRAEGISEALELVRPFLSGPTLVEPEESVPGVSFLTGVERDLDVQLFRQIRRRVRVNPLGPGLLVMVLLEKIFELANIRMVLRGRMASLPDPAVSRLLVLEA